ncbi:MULTISPECIES: hypothetical protein [unclassified Streptomyces]|uniref:hypothetical protein n=1 Tax=unclassified Streptomyces TaxID=2593676 RepID=UPI002E2B760B|nr:hypothetical protein [Streptomyces sp. NBC_01423]WSX91223.1 hypothetical protein OH827_12065 [Streptomyces sp. NBC_00891]WSY05701.1 hypothetical protein OG464_12065 [Streptomyces sp. NBC_00890]WSZ07325.1 hypothetical protein OG704_12065 [Streptomyces sp. NBC_00869]WSZ25176.1 hypothetical protein OG498_21500 [Streptomyces sp. NBC_00870]
MNPETHLATYRVHSPEMRLHVRELRLARRTALRRKLRNRLGWTIVEVGMRVLPAGSGRPAGAPRAV